MNKIPTVFRRDPDNMRNVLPEVNPGCEWVLSGEGKATRKWDGTCVMFDGTAWFARREVRPGKQTPPNFVPIETDAITGKTVGWEPVEQSGFAKWHAQALDNNRHRTYRPGTYELIGPKINGNPEKAPEHSLVNHENTYVYDGEGEGRPRSYESIRELVLDLGDEGVEGVVYHHPDGRMAKIKARDFR